MSDKFNWKDITYFVSFLIGLFTFLKTFRKKEYVSIDYKTEYGDEVERLLIGLGVIEDDFNDHFIITEWVYRKGNSATPTMATTFENYKDYNGIKIATDHKMEGGNWNLNFTDVTITLDE